MVRCKATIFSATQIPVGAGLPAKAPAHSKSSSPVTPLSRAGSLPQWSGANLRSLSHPKSPVGAGLPAKAPAHSTSLSPDPALSRAGSLLQRSGADQQSLSQPKSLWERACSRRRQIKYIHIECHTAFASRLAPTMVRGKSTIFVAPQIPCGSGLAREGVGTFNIIIATHTAFASKLAPTMVRGRSATLVATQIFVGASLLAKASAHSTSSSPVTPLSRASSLPQWSGARPQSSEQPKSLWERACPRRRQIRYIHVE